MQQMRATDDPNYEPSLSHSSEPVVFIKQQRLTFIARSRRATNSPNELEGGQVMVTEERLIVFLVKNHNIKELGQSFQDL